LPRKYEDTIVLFDKTPSDILCPHFIELRWAFGCQFDCAWCYLQGTGYGNKAFRAYSLPQILAHLRRFFQENRAFSKSLKCLTDVGSRCILNSGELSDSYPNHPNIRAIMDAFAKQDRHKLLLLTKTADPQSLLETYRKNVVYSVSVNAESVASRWELRAPKPSDRLRGLEAVMEKGYETRVRIDPIIPVFGWRDAYAHLARHINEVGPARVTLGTLRGLQRTLIFARMAGKDLTWTQYLQERTSWGLKMSSEKRRKVYEFLMERITAPVAVCKETRSLAASLGFTDSMKCNCVD
jgi:spore photoproduct lyase